MPTDESFALPTVTTIPQVRFSDTDAMGHVSSMSYAAWAEVGRADFFAAIGDPTTPWFVLVRLELDFHAEGRFGESFTIVTRPLRIGTKSLLLEQVISVGDRKVCTVKVTLAGFDPATRTSCAVSPRWTIPS
jgi:acyl-CoA thioester hydrolase